jgi:hypothetical protein
MQRFRSFLRLYNYNKKMLNNIEIFGFLKKSSIFVSEV